VIRSGFLAAAVLASMSVVPARASLVASDDFEGAAIGNLDGVSTGTGWTTDWASQSFMSVVEVNTAGTPTLSYSNGAIQMNGGLRAAQVGNGGAGPIDNAFNRAFTAQSDTVYFSLLARQVAGQDSSTDFVQWGLTEDTDINNSGSFGTAVAADSYTIFARRRNTSSDVNGASTTTFTQGTTYLLVGKLSKVSGSTSFNRIRLFINPDSLSEADNAVTSVSDGSIGIESVTSLIGRIARLDANDRILFDNVRVGTSFADVVPEPASVSLLVLAGGLMRRRR
jgi:hypothetical protein